MHFCYAALMPPKLKPRPVRTAVARVASAAAGVILGRGRVSAAVAQARLAICQGLTPQGTCPAYTAQHTCQHCGCYMPTKVIYQQVRAAPGAPWTLNVCPRGLW